MQDFEIPRYNAALSAFADAFDKGYAAGKRELASGAAQRTDVDSVFYVEVSRDKVVDDEWRPYCVWFEEAGRAAALAKRRTKEAKLDATDAVDGSRVPFDRNMFRWAVILNPHM